MKRRGSFVLFGVLLLCGLLGRPYLRAQTTAGPTPPTYSATVINALLGPPVTFKIYRDGPKELIDRVQPAGPGITPSHIVQLYDFQAGTAFTWDAMDASVPCGKSTTPDKAADFSVDPISGVAQWMAMIDPSKSKSAGADVVNGIATKAMEAADPASKLTAKIWLADKGGYVVKYVVTPAGGTPQIKFEIKALAFDKPAASVFVLPAACSGVPVTGSFSTSSTPAAAPAAPAGSKVTSAVLKMVPVKYTGVCTAAGHAQLTATVATNGPGTVWYRFEMGALGYPQGQEGTLVFARAGSMTVTKDVTFEWFAKVGFGGGGGYVSAAVQDAQGRHDSSVVNSANVEYSVECASAASAPATPAANAASAPAPMALPIRINAGGPAQTDTAGIRWEADKGFAGGIAYQNTNAPVTAPAAGGKAPNLFQTERYAEGEFSYSFDVPNGTYSVRLRFAEIYFKNPGERVFAVDANDKRVLDRFDIVVAAKGPNVPVDRQFQVEVTNGKLRIHFVKIVQNPKVNALEIVKVR